MQVMCNPRRMSAESNPKLAPPGAGLPAYELYIARLKFGWYRARRTRASINAQFQSERTRIRRSLQSLSDSAAARRVLIARLRGLEDSSRYWSIWMTLDHLRIVHGAVTRAIRALAKDEMPREVASTAAVKPSPDVRSTVVAEYEASCDELLATVAAVDELRTRLRYAHPWFGPLDAAGWHALAAVHIGIHRSQIERISEGLAGADA
jgi:hypothetical protein